METPKIGKNIQIIRKSHNLTQEQVSIQLQLIGIPMSRKTYAKIEEGFRNIRIKELLALKVIFNCEFNDFFEGLPLPEPPK